MAGSIDSISDFLAWYGRISWPTHQVADIAPLPGVADQGTSTGAAQALATDIMTRQRFRTLTLAAAAATRAIALMAPGTAPVRVVEPVGLVWDEVSVLSCSPQFDYQLDGTWILTIAWRLRPLASVSAASA